MQAKGISSSSKSSKAGSNSLVSDIGIVKKKKDSPSSNDSKNEGIGSASLLLEDSFEKYYNKDLDLEED